MSHYQRNSSSARKISSRHQPYDRCKRTKQPSPNRTTVVPQFTSALSSANHQLGTLRDGYLQYIHDKYPNIQPRNDFDILILGSGKYEGPNKEVYAWLDVEIAGELAGMPQADVDAYLKHMSKILDGPGTITGLKPQPGSPNVFVRPIPNSQYSIRLFPGSIMSRHYCMDFVRTRTGEPVNSPFDYELWSAPQSSMSQSLSSGSMQVVSLEERWGMLRRGIPPGKEKFVLTDGQTYVLKRKGERNVRFTVPYRKVASLRSGLDDGDYKMSFPSAV